MSIHVERLPGHVMVIGKEQAENFAGRFDTLRRAFNQNFFNSTKEVYFNLLRSDPIVREIIEYARSNSE